MLPTITGDTLVVWSNHDGETVPGIAWELWESNEWYPISSSDSWSLNVALAIYPIVQNTLGVNENNVSDGLNIYPNPSDGHYIIDFTKHTGQELQLEIFNTTGNCILDQTFEKWANSISFDISDFPAGIYMVRLNGGQQSYIQKILKR